MTNLASTVRTDSCAIISLADENKQIFFNLSTVPFNYQSQLSYKGLHRPSQEQIKSGSPLSEGSPQFLQSSAVFTLVWYFFWAVSRFFTTIIAAKGVNDSE